MKGQGHRQLKRSSFAQSGYGDISDSIVDRIYETCHRIAAYFGNDFMRMARFGAGELDLPPDFFTSSRKDPQLAPAMVKNLFI